ncbi:YeiH family protein [Zafaria sp. Z1313]|uniref:YeiH family protein n=1 Tax=unclassified Zafaria TaxID=2828765 RepID=UPI002E77D681|nr:putative sulfate exporter family transporter [Zafaria sp. J156]MEE1620231.1 putative sulfate exporter family transporter [Zafaria sp. J156]
MYPVPAPRRRAVALAPGLAAAAAAVGLAFAAARILPGIPALTWCVVLGLALGSVPLPRAAVRFRASLDAGLDVAAMHLMRAGIVLLGLQLALSDVVALGWAGLAAVAGVVAVAFAATWAAARAAGLPGDQPVLLAAGFSICGASAVGALAQARGTSRDAGLPVALVTLCGTLAIAALPAANLLLGLGPVAFGHWVGASVHDVGQVVATAQSAGSAALAAAVVVKLVRVLALAPVAIAGGWLARSGNDAGASRCPPLVPWFVAGFAAACLLRSTGWVPAPVLDGAHVAQELLLGAALVGLGFAIRPRELLGQARRALGVALVAWAAVAAAGLGAAWIIAST